MSHPILPLASLQSAVFLLNSRTSLFVATRRCSGSKSRHKAWHPFSRSYGANLPSSLTWFLSRTLVFSTFLPVSVSGTDTLSSTLRSFSCQRSPLNSAYPEACVPYDSQAYVRSFNPGRPTAFDRLIQQPAQLSYCVPPSLQ